MSLKDAKSNRKVAERMVQAVIGRSISHAYLLEGDRSIDKLSLAKDFIKAILCNTNSGDCCDCCQSCNKINHGNHEDVIYLSAEGNSIKDEAVEELQNRIKKKPFIGDRNIVIIQDADTMTPRAQNRLLKTLEEPAHGTVLILLSENQENLVQTILSRCVIYRLTSQENFEYGNVLEGAIEIADMLLQGKAFYEISKELAEYVSSKGAALEFLDALESWYRDLSVCEYDPKMKILLHIEKAEEIGRRGKLYHRSAIDKAIASIEIARNDLNRNLNISYTIKNMILKMIA